MRILVAENAFPEPDRNSGDSRLIEILRILLGCGHDVTFLAECCGESRYREALDALGVHTVWDPDRTLRQDDTIRDFLKVGRFDVAILGRFSRYRRYGRFLRWYAPDCAVILDTVDLHYVRLRREAELAGDPEKRVEAERVRDVETRCIRESDAVWVVTPDEADTIKMLSAAIQVVPNIHRVEPNPPTMEARKGIVFLGNYTHTPNVDGIDWFISDVWPRVRDACTDAVLTIAGSNPVSHFREYVDRDPRIRVTGYVEDHRALLMTHRVGIAPLRFGAGMKGKLGEYACCGLPCVTTAIGSEGMGLLPDRHILLADDAGAFATGVVRLYEDSGLWHKLAEASRNHIESATSPSAIAPCIEQSLQQAMAIRAAERKLFYRVGRRLGGMLGRRNIAARQA